MAGSSGSPPLAGVLLMYESTAESRSFASRFLAFGLAVEFKEPCCTGGVLLGGEECDCGAISKLCSGLSETSSWGDRGFNSTSATGLSRKSEDEDAL